MVLRSQLPEADASEIAVLARVGEGAPGRALAFAGLDIAGLDAAIDRLITQGDPSNAERSALARTLALKASQPRYEAFLERATARMAAEAKRRHGPALERALALWAEARDLASSAAPLSLDAQSTTFVLAGMLAAMAMQNQG
jgi:DNA polymerase III subunit delta'